MATTRPKSNASRCLPRRLELQRGPADLRFDPQLEAEYARTYLLNSRTLILLACVAAMLLGILRGSERIIAAGWGGIHPLDLTFVLVGSLVLTALAAGSAFERLYLPWARIIVPIRNILVAAHVVTAVGSGQYEMLMILPLALIGPFFFLGFSFRMGLACGVLTAASFIANAALLHLAPALALRTSVLLLLSLGVCAIAARHLDKWSRTAFLETRANADLAQHDALTGTKNRRVFDAQLLRLWEHANEDDRTIAVLLVDVDHFKAYNDRYGHQAGDQALRRVAQAIQTFACRPLDILARYGGEEFAAVLYDIDEQQAAQVAERMRRAVEELNIAHQGSRAFGRVTVSIGVAAIRPTQERNAQGAVQLADQALYEAKTGGRNRIRTMSDNEHRMLVTGIFSNAPRTSTTERKQA